MEKALKITPVFLFLLLISINKITTNINFKLTSLILIILIDLIIFYYLLRKKLISSRSMYTFLIFFLITTSIFLYTYFSK
jgi:hypothetical protein